MALSYEEQIQIEIQKIKNLKRKQKLEEKKFHEELGRMLLDVYPGITPETFREFISQNAKKRSDDSDFVD